MVVVSLRESEILSIALILANQELPESKYNILCIFNKFYRAMPKRGDKLLISEFLKDFKKLNKITELKVYKKK